MKPEKHKCCAIINYTNSRDIIIKMISSLPHEICGCNAKYFEQDDWYCGKHAPSKVREREDKSFQKWKAQMEAKGIKG